MMWDAIVIGSGIGGLAAAAALVKRKRRVLVLEQHGVAGGLTQTFKRREWTFAPSVHYIAGDGPQPGPEGQFGWLLGWLSDGALSFGACANPYDIITLPGFEFGIAHPESAYHGSLLQLFPGAAGPDRRLVRQLRRGAPRRAHAVRAAQHAGLDGMGTAPVARGTGRALGTAHPGRRTRQDR
jgi:phytoene dehydrogenase-like protein